MSLTVHYRCFNICLRNDCMREVSAKLPWTLSASLLLLRLIREFVDLVDGLGLPVTLHETLKSSHAMASETNCVAASQGMLVHQKGLFDLLFQSTVSIGDILNFLLPILGNCKRGRQKGVSLICSENKSEEIEEFRNKSVKQGVQIGTHPEENREVGTNRGEPCGADPKAGATTILHLLLPAALCDLAWQLP